MAPQALLDHYIDLALEQLVQASWLADADGDLRLGAAELRQACPQSIDVETGMDADMQKACDALRLELGGGVGEETKCVTHRH